MAALTLDIAKVKKDLSVKNYLAAGEILGEMLAIVTEPVTADHARMMNFDDLQ